MARHSKTYVDVMGCATGNEHHGVMLPRMSPVFDRVSTKHGHNVTTAVFTLVILPVARTARERYASGYPCTHCVHCVGFVRYTQTTSGGVLRGRQRYASGWRCSVNARVDESGSPASRRLRMSTDWPISFHSINL